LQAFLFLAKNYPKVSPIKDILENSQNKMTCYSLNKLTLLPDGREVKCRYMKYKEGDFKNTVDYSSNENIILGHLQENECLSCEWFSKCSFRCFVQADWAARQKTERCFLKSFFEETSQWN
jgi:radical SAM protein with 4Fe4S-binding SPASM domain